MAVSYYGVCIPDKRNWVETPEGYVIFRNAVIGRTGFQRYKGYELDKDELMEQGFPVKDDDDVQLYRSPEEVFSPATIASFECKSITDGHPSELLSIENVREHELGQVTNVHRGAEPLESGDYPLLADLHVKSRMLIDKIKSGLKELSCGYNYHVRKDGDLIKQVQIIGNHVAIVENARAGREAVIVDSAPEPTPEPRLERWDINVNLLDKILTSNRKSKLTAWAKDAKPEEVAEAIDSLVAEAELRPDVITKVRVAHDVKPATDAKDNPDRKKWHDAIDRYFDGNEQEQEMKDNELKSVAKMIKGSAKDSAVDQEKEKEKPGEDEEGEDEEEEEEEEEAEKGSDESSLVIEPEDRPEKLGPGTDAEDLRKARVEGANLVLRQLKPLIAKTGNKKLIAAYDTAVKTINGKSKISTPGGYGAFVEAANRRGKDALDSIDNSAQKRQMDAIAGYEKLYAERFNVTKRG